MAEYDAKGLQDKDDNKLNFTPTNFMDAQGNSKSIEVEFGKKQNTLSVEADSADIDDSTPIVKTLDGAKLKTALAVKFWNYIKGNANSVYAALNHTHVTDSAEVVNSVGDGVITDDTDFVTTHVNGYSSTNKKLYRRNAKARVWPWIKGLLASESNVNISGSASKLGLSSAVGDDTQPVYFNANGIPAVIPKTAATIDGTSVNVLNVAVKTAESSDRALKAGKLSKPSQATNAIDAKEPEGVYMNMGYRTGSSNNGYPAQYGNVLTLGGTGGSQLFLEWSGTTQGIARVWYRNRRDVATAAGECWSEWKALAWYDEKQNNLPNNGGSGANLKYNINISGTADNALAADAAGVAGKLDASGGSSIQPVYFPSSGNNAGKPVPIPFDSTLTSYLTLQVTNANYANSSGTAGKWTTPRSITIKDDSLTNAGTPTTGVDGSGNIILRLPTTIIANIAGTAEQANKDSNGNWINLTYATKSELSTNHYTKSQSDSLFAAASEGSLGFSSPGNPQNYSTGTSSSLSGNYIVQFSKGSSYANSIAVLPTFAEGTTAGRVNVPLYKDTTERDTASTLIPNSTTAGYGTVLRYAYERKSGKIGTLVGAVCLRPVVYKYVNGSVQEDTLLTDSEDWYLMSKSGTKVKGSVKPSDYSTLSIKMPSGLNNVTGVGIVNVIENSSVTARVWCKIENGLLTFITDASNFSVFSRGKFYGFNVILNF